MKDLLKLLLLLIVVLLGLVPLFLATSGIYLGIGDYDDYYEDDDDYWEGYYGYYDD
ncbi:MAG: hypothetical protein GXO00_02730 [Candidatus Diapherotrites archaeon]|nr:hypothetical protein [Candidatus Diapherotrites archaeon]